MSKTVAAAIEGFARLVTAPMKPVRQKFTRALASERLVQTVVAEAPNGTLTFLCPTQRSLQDPVNLHGNEPETRKWIDSFSDDGEILWDIGANIGVFSLYAALRPNVTVQAFEPSAATFATLVRNIELNGFGPRISAHCLALSDRTGLDFLHMENTGSGHATHAFGEMKTIDGDIDPVFSQAVPGITADDFVSIFGAPRPTHIKLDVDSIEEKIIRGGPKTFGAARSVMVEAFNSAREPLMGAARALEELGFVPDHEFNAGNLHNHLFVNTRKS